MKLVVFEKKKTLKEKIDKILLDYSDVHFLACLKFDKVSDLRLSIAGFCMKYVSYPLMYLKNKNLPKDFWSQYTSIEIVTWSVYFVTYSTARALLRLY